MRSRTRSHDRSFLIGLDFGTESARGVLIDVGTGQQLAGHVHPYRHGVMTSALADGTPLARGWALQDADDYLEAARDILSVLGRDRWVEGIGVGFTASSPLPTDNAGTPLSRSHPSAPHAYVKLWKHAAAQAQADKINRIGGRHLEHFGGKVSAEWLLAKAWQIVDEAPDIWHSTHRFIEAGDWLVQQLSGHEMRAAGFAAYKAQFTSHDGYPDVVPNLLEKLSAPHPAGTSAGELMEEWRRTTGIRGPAHVAVAVIDSHVVLPAVHGVETGTLVAALGTSAVYLYLSQTQHPLPPGIEGMAFGGSIPGAWCYEAGQAGFGDALAWFVRTFAQGDTEAEGFRKLGEAASLIPPGRTGLMGLDWWSGNRVPWADSQLSGLLAGFTTLTRLEDIFRAMIEAVCFGARDIVERFEKAGCPINRIILTSGLTSRNPLLVQTISDVLGKPVDIPVIENATSVGAAIHGAVAAGTVGNFAEGSQRYGAKKAHKVSPSPSAKATYSALFEVYKNLSGNADLRASLMRLRELSQPGI